MLGLRRGEVTIVDHQPEWEKVAATTIKDLKEIFGNTALEIQHIGSTAICNIKAKPIIDIAVGIESFEALTNVLPRLEESGIYIRSHNRFSRDLLYVINDTESKRTHQIHILKKDNPQWYNYIAFRDYMNTFPEKAKEYENLKIELVEKCLNNQSAYTDGKQAFMSVYLFEARLYAEMRKKLDITKFEPISKGLSSDKKYYVETADERKYLMRLSDISEYDRKKRKYFLMKEWNSLGVPMSRPVEFGLCDDGSSVYQLLSWCEGRNLDEVLPRLSESERYKLGIKAGKALHRIHSIPAQTEEDWYDRYISVIDERIKAFLGCGVRFKGWEKIYDFYLANMHLLHNRPQVYLHGDYHAGNLMLSDSGEISVIDWEPLDFEGFGDPWAEITMQECPYFSSGLTDGYFDGKIPKEFWIMQAFYCSVGALTSIPWAFYNFPEELDSRIKLCDDILKWYDGMRNSVPSRYIQNFKIATPCFCGHDCSRCVTYLATVRNNDELRKQSQLFYKNEFDLDIPLSEIHCKGGRSDDVFKLCPECPWMKCCLERKIDVCSDCPVYPCKPLVKYQAKYVNKCNQL